MSSPEPFLETQFEPQPNDSQNLWEAEEILDERGGTGARGEYLIKWKGIDPKTGEEYKPTWEAKSGCTPALIKSWKNWKKKNQKSTPIKDSKKRKGKNGESSLTADTAIDGGQASESETKNGKKRKRQLDRTTKSKKAKGESSKAIHDTARDKASSIRSDSRVSHDQSEASDVRMTGSGSGSSTQPPTRQSLPPDGQPAKTVSASLTETNPPLPQTTSLSVPTDPFVPPQPSSSTSPPTVQPLPATERNPRGRKKILEVEIPVIKRQSPRSHSEASPGPTTAHEQNETPLPPPSETEGPDKAPTPTNHMEVEKSDKPPTTEITEKTKPHVTFADHDTNGEAISKPSFTPTPAPSRKSPKPSSPKKLPKKSTKSRQLGPVPVPSTSTFRQMVQADTTEDTQTTSSSNAISQNDPIGQFSSPTQPPVVATVGKSEEKGAKASDHSEAEPESQEADNHIEESDEHPIDSLQIIGDVWAEMMEEEKQASGAAKVDVARGDENSQDSVTAEESQKPRTGLKIIDGEEVWAVLSDASDEKEEMSLGKDGDQSMADKTENKVVEAPQGRSTNEDGVPAVAAAGVLSEPVNLRCVVEKAVKESETNVAISDVAVEDQFGKDEGQTVFEVEVGGLDDEDLALLTASTDDDRPNFGPEDGSKTVEDDAAISKRIDDQNQTDKKISSSVSQPKDGDPFPIDAEKAALLSNIKLLVANAKSLRALVTERDPTVAELVSRLVDVEQSLQSRTGDLEFLQKQYRQASDRAVEEVGTSTKLRSEVTTLRQQLTLGLQQRDLHYDTIKKKMISENRKLKMQNQFLLEQSRKTDDNVRRKAAQYPKTRAENEILKERVYELEQKVSKLSERNEDLVSQVGILRAREMGVFGEEEDTDSEEQTSSGVDGGRLSRIGYVASGLTASEDVKTSLPVVNGGDKLMMKGTTGDDMEVGEAYWCKWKEGDGNCPVIHYTSEGLSKHVIAHIDGTVDSSGQSLESGLT